MAACQCSESLPVGGLCALGLPRLRIEIKCWTEGVSRLDENYRPTLRWVRVFDTTIFVGLNSTATSKGEQ